MASNELRNKTELTSASGTEWVYVQENASPYTVKKLSITAFFLPIGTRIMFDGTSAPDNYLLCDGSAISRTTYSDLFGVIGETFGSGDGSTTFNIPDMQGLSPKGVGDATINGRTKTGPSALGETQEDQMQKLTGSFLVYAGILNETNSTGVFSVTNGVSTRPVNGTNAGYATLTFDSANSPDARVSTTTAGVTRDSTLGTNFYIKYR